MKCPKCGHEMQAHLNSGPVGQWICPHCNNEERGLYGRPMLQHEKKDIGRNLTPPLSE